MRILIAEDEPLSHRLLETFLHKWGYDVIMATDGAQAWKTLQQDDAPRIAILDWMMPEMDGVELCQKIRTTCVKKYVYIILLTARASKDDIIVGLESGADDYIIKPFDADQLKCRIKIGQRIIDLEDKLQKMASIDYLTGALNRRSFRERLEAEMNRSRRQNTPLAIILSDIDFFKMVNDRHGHQMGDVVLQEFARCLIKASRVYDFAGRYGGEEFLVCCPGASGAQAIPLAQRMKENVAALRIPLPGKNESIRITASFGVAWLISEEDHADALIARADEALYQAKAAGRNKVCPAIGEF
jgi:two-component system cell cycle response regulator